MVILDGFVLLCFLLFPEFTFLLMQSNRILNQQTLSPGAVGSKLPQHRAQRCWEGEAWPGIKAPRGQGPVERAPAAPGGGPGI